MKAYKLPLNPHVQQLPTLALERYFRIFGAKPDAIRMDIGEPYFSTPPHICAAAARLVETGRVRYNPGMPELKRALAHSVANHSGVEYDPLQEIIISQGAIGGLWASIQVLVRSGDEVLLPDPCWPTLVQMIRMVGAQPVFYPFCRPVDRDRLVGNLSTLITERTALMVLIAPHNPTGLMLDQAQLTALGKLVLTHRFPVLSDDTYEHIVFDDRHFHSLAAEAGLRDRVIVVKSFSKSYSMTGWRVGAILGSAEVIREINKVNEVATGGLSPVAQVAALAALEGPQQSIAECRQAYQYSRDTLARHLSGASIRYTPTEGAFFTFVEIPDEMEVDATVEALFYRKGVAVMPGHVFGVNGSRYVRVSLTVTPEQVEIGAAALADMLRKRTV